MSLSLPATAPAAMGGGSGNWIISPDTGFPIKKVDAKGQPGKAYQALLDSPKFRAATLAARSYPGDPSNPNLAGPQARADAQALRDQRGGVVRNAQGKVLSRQRASRDTKKVAWFNAATKRIVLKPENFKPGNGSQLMFRSDAGSEEASKAAARQQAVAAGMLKAKNTTGVTRKANPDARYVEGGKALKNGHRAWIKVDGPEYNQRYKTEAAFLESLPKYSMAQRKQASADRSGRARKSASERAAATAAAKSRLARVRPGAGEFTLCVVNPDSGRAVGVRRTNGTTTGGARTLAKSVGGEDKATSKSEGKYVISDARIIQIIEGLVASGRLAATTAGTKCRG